MKDLIPIAEQIATKLIAKRQTIAVSESSTGGLISAALLAVPGASAYFLGGAVVYTRDARRVLMDITDPDMVGMRSASEPYAQLLAKRLCERFSCDAFTPARSCLSVSSRAARPDRDVVSRSDNCATTCSRHPICSASVAER